MKNKLFLSVLFIILLTFHLSSDEIVDTYMKNARTYYIFKDYDNAYTYINFVLMSFKDEETPAKVYLLAEQIYYEYLKNQIKNNNRVIINELTNNLSVFTPIESDRIAILLDDYNNKLKEELQKKQEIKENQEKIEEKKIKKQEERQLWEEELQKKFEAAKVEDEIEQNKFERSLKEKELEHKLRMVELQKVIIEDKLKEKKSEESKDKFNEMLLTILSTKDKSSNTPLIMIIVFFSFIIIFVIIFIFLSIRSAHIQQLKFFEYSNRNITPSTNIFSIPMISTPVDHTRMIEDKSKEKNFPDNDEMGKFKRLLEKCDSYSIEIDNATNRQNCSKNVAELVYKISKKFDYSEIECMLHYAVGLIYDIGFLNIDPTILSQKEISEEQFKIIREHTTMGLNMIHFIDEQYKSIFKDAILKHHENIDGSGYPNKIKNDEIPYIARVIRVVESYIAQTSMREYKEIKDKKTAIQELYNENEKYDIEIIKTLELVI